MFQSEILKDERKLWLASSWGKLTKVKRLLSNGMVNVNCVGPKCQNSSTPLYTAASHGHKKVVKLLLDRGAVINKANDGGYTPLSVAAIFGHAMVAKILLDRGAECNTVDEYVSTPLYIKAAEEWSRGLGRWSLMREVRSSNPHGGYIPHVSRHGMGFHPSCLHAWHGVTPPDCDQWQGW